MKQTYISATLKTGLKVISIVLLVLTLSIEVSAQNEKIQRITAINFDSKGLDITMASLTSLVIFELEETKLYDVLDKYEVAKTMKENNIDQNIPYGKTDLIRIGGILKADMIISGSAEKFGNKIIVSIRLINVKEGRVETVNVMEFNDKEEYILEMIQVSIRSIFQIPNNPLTVEIVTNSEKLDSKAKTKVTKPSLPLNKNVIYGMLGLYFPYMGSFTGTVYAERLISPSVLENKVSFILQIGYGGNLETSIGREGSTWSNHYFLARVGVLFGGNDHHFECGLGMCQATFKDTYSYPGNSYSTTYSERMPSTHLGYRYQKPNGNLIIKLGGAFPEGPYMGVGVAF